MQLAKTTEKMNQDYVDTYQKAINDVIAACGSKENANRMLDDLHANYERIEAKLAKADRDFKGDADMRSSEKQKILEIGKHEVHQIIEKHAPHASGHIEEMIIGTSLAVTAALLPATHAAATLVAATSIIAIGGSYYIGFKLLKNWKMFSGKHRMANLAGVVGPKHVSLPNFKLIKKK